MPDNASTQTDDVNQTVSGQDRGVLFQLTPTSSAMAVESYIDIRIKNLLQDIKFKSENAVNIQFNNIRSSKIRLKTPLTAVLEKANGEVVLNCRDIDLYGVGDTEQEAITDFSENLEDFFYLLKGEGRKKLAPQMLHIWDFLKKVITEKK